VQTLRHAGVTIILTTHYIEEAEEMADRVGVINHGEIILVQDKHRLMRELGKKQLVLNLIEPLTAIPAQLGGFVLDLANDGHDLVYTYDTAENRTGITALLGVLAQSGIRFSDLHTSQSSLEEIFVNLVKNAK
jgi:ABC-2 type transport system ATP-binding protein